MHWIAVSCYFSRCCKVGKRCRGWGDIWAQKKGKKKAPGRLTLVWVGGHGLNGKAQLEKAPLCQVGNRGKQYAKNQPGHRLTPFKFCRSHIFGRNAERKNREETRSRYGATDFSVFIPFVFVWVPSTRRHSQYPCPKFDIAALLYNIYNANILKQRSIGETSKMHLFPAMPKWVQNMQNTHRAPQNPPGCQILKRYHGLDITSSILYSDEV